MPLSERSRSAIYQNLEPLLGEEAVGEMLSYFPARDVEEPATKEFVRAEIATVRAEMAGIRTEIADLRTAFHKDQRELLAWMVATSATFAGLVIAAFAFLR